MYLEAETIRQKIRGVGTAANQAPFAMMSAGTGDIISRFCRAITMDLIAEYVFRKRPRGCVLVGRQFQKNPGSVGLREDLG